MAGILVCHTVGMDIIGIVVVVGLWVLALYLVVLWVVQTVRSIRQWFRDKLAALGRRGKPQPKRRTDARQVLVRVNRRDV